MNIKTNEGNEDTQSAVLKIAAEYGHQFVRKDNKFFDVEHLNTPLSRNDVEMMLVNRITEEHPDIQLTSAIIKGVLSLLIVQRHSDRERSFQVWNGTASCLPGQVDRLVFERGAVQVNTWAEPAYRQLRINSADLGVIEDFLNLIFQSEHEKNLFLDWFAWCIQHEDQKPAWAPFFFSKSKGTGKSTLCRILGEVFGVQNTAVQNNLDKLTQQFNATVLRSKLVISEETHLKAGSTKGNSLKTLITDPFVLVEQKGKEAVREANFTCYAFTSNFAPTWIEAGERRYAVFEIEHEGRSGGEQTEEFVALVAKVHAFLNDAANVARVYNALIARQQADAFNAKALNMEVYATPTMKRLEQTNRQTTLEQVEELLNELRVVVAPQTPLLDLLTEKFRVGSSQAPHLMTELGWTKAKVKWGGADYSRVLWVKQDFIVERGKIYGPDHKGTKVVEYLKGLPQGHSLAELDVAL